MVTLMDFIRDYWWLIAAAAVLLVLVLVLFRPRQRVRLSDEGPVRPHLQQHQHHQNTRPPQGRGLGGEAAAATSDITGELIGAQVHRKLGGGSEPGDDLTLIKGIGPKLADQLHDHGFHRFEQLAKLTPTEVERLEGQLGGFRGRLSRDRVVEQAEYLARGDIDGFEQRFGKLSS